MRESHWRHLKTKSTDALRRLPPRQLNKWERCLAIIRGQSKHLIRHEAAFSETEKGMIRDSADIISAPLENQTATPHDASRRR